jgi:hypothetical protein
MRNAYILVGNPEEQRPFGKPSVEDNIKTCHRKVM